MLNEITSCPQKSVAFLQRQGVLLQSVKCPGPCFDGGRPDACGNFMALKYTNDTRDGIIWRCRKKHQSWREGKKYTTKDVKLTVRHRSWLVDTKIPLASVIEMMYLWSQAFSIEEIIHELKLSRKTVIEWTIFFRESCFTVMIESSEAIGGNGVEVEIDESKFGRRKYYKGHRVEGQWVFGGREKYNKSLVFMVPVKNRKKETLVPLIKKWIKPGSIIHSDCWKAYNELTSLGYTHVTVNHSKEFINKENAACTNSIESDWRHAKVMLPKYGVQRGLHAAYLTEFMWRRKYSTEDRFLQLVKDINVAFKMKYICKVPTSSK